MQAQRRELPPGLHLIPGSSAAGSFQQAFGNEANFLVHEDILSFGPTPRCSIDEWIEIRNGFLGFGENKSRNDLSLHAKRLVADGPVNIWAGSGIEDQLFVAFAADLARQVGRARQELQLVQYSRLPSGGFVVGLGELNPSQLSEFPDPLPLQGGLLESYEKLWEAVTSSSPHELYQFSDRIPEADEIVRAAASLMRRRYPKSATGLSYWDFELLRQTRARGPRAVRVVGFTMSHEHFRSADWVSDFHLYDRMHALADPSMPKPLLVHTNFGAPMRENEVRLTEFGNAVLDGFESNHPANPIDFWVGGVHLSSADGRLWLDDGEKLVAS